MRSCQQLSLVLSVVSLLLGCKTLIVDAMASDALALHYTQPPAECPLHRTLRVRLDDSGVQLSLQLVESSEEFLHSSERIVAKSRRGAAGGGRGDGGPEFESVSRDGSSLMDLICFYQGEVEPEGGLAVIKQRSGLISGTFHYGNRVYEIPEQPVVSATSKRPLRANRMARSAKATCGVSGGKIKPMASEPTTEPDVPLHRSRRAVRVDTNSNYSEVDRKYIQLILVGDQYFYRNQSSNMTRSQDRLWEIGNYLNALYKQLGVSVITVYTETWTTDPYTLYSATNPAGANSSEQLDLFMNYRMSRLSSKTHSAAHLITGLKYSGTDVGLAHLGKLCSFSLGGGVNSDREANAYGVAVTVAHELGHNLGLNHDEDERGCGTCPDSQGCVMAAVGSDVNPVRFSNCSVYRFLDFTVPNGLGYCMTNPPDDAAVTGAKTTCGNRIVETGEDCDCGPARWCNNTCCNPTTCLFTPGSVCASGECCNTATCQLKAQGVVCRTERGVCDLPEYCNGSSEWCPQFDDYKVDGTECLAGKAYCYKGRCNDRDSRCAALFNGTNFAAANPSWSVATTQGLQSGYCSYNESSLHPLNYTYTACTTANQRCGLLYCVGGNIGSSDPMPKWKGLDPPDIRVLDGTISGLAITAAYALHNLKYSGYRDPALVPNGAECGTNMMCVDSVCVSTSVSVTCPSCNSRGSCAQSGLCFCQTGYRPPDCLQVGGGGSLTNRLPDNATATTGGTTASTASTSSAGATTAAGGATTTSAVITNSKSAGRMETAKHQQILMLALSVLLASMLQRLLI